MAGLFVWFYVFGAWRVGVFVVWLHNPEFEGLFGAMFWCGADKEDSLKPWLNKHGL